MTGQSASAATCAYTVRQLSVADTALAARWDAFVDANPDATFFHRAGWQRVLETAFGHTTWYLLAEAGDRIEAILPLAEVQSRWFGHTLCSLPFCVYGGIVARSAGAADALDAAARQLAGRLGVDHLEYRNRDAAADAATTPASPLYVTFRKALSPQAEHNMLAIPRKQRAMVRKGIAAGLYSTDEDDIGAFFAAYASSVHRLGTPVFAPRYFHLLKQVFGSDCQFITVFRHSERRQQGVAAVLVFYFKNEVLPYYGGGHDNARLLGGNDFMYWEVMRRAAGRGSTLFDFGRSKVGTGAFDFKKNWGFTPQPLHYAYRLQRASAVPQHHPLNPKYQLLIRAWRRLPLPVANLIGPHIVRHLG
jgi:FemAB-related protein (PEP-CTERM system-associated)